MTKPRWATAVRKARLVHLWHRYGNRCLPGHPTCPDRDHYVQVDAQCRTQFLRLYDVNSEEAVRYWVSDDAAQRMAEWKAEQARLHRVPDRKFRQEEFDSIRREKFLAEQLPYYLVALAPAATMTSPNARNRSVMRTRSERMGVQRPIHAGNLGLSLLGVLITYASSCSKDTSWPLP